MAMLSHTSTESRMAGTRTNLWKGAGVTAFAALLFPRINAVIYDNEKIWHLDSEAAMLAPLVVVLSLALFAAVGPVAWRGGDNRPAVVSLVTGALSIVGIVAFWISAPIMFGGLAVTLGIEGVQRAPESQRRRLAVAGIVLGVVGALAGAGLWLAGI